MTQPSLYKQMVRNELKKSWQREDKRKKKKEPTELTDFEKVMTGHLMNLANYVSHGRGKTFLSVNPKGQRLLYKQYLIIGLEKFEKEIDKFIKAVRDKRKVKALMKRMVLEKDKKANQKSKTKREIK